MGVEALFRNCDRGKIGEVDGGVKGERSELGEATLDTNRNELQYAHHKAEILT
jgi:hypothetical protein